MEGPAAALRGASLEQLRQALEDALVWVVQVNEIVLLADQSPGTVLKRDAAERQLLL